jgi:two-component system, OmpR family, response regulator
MKVMIIDDNESITKLISKYLTLKKHEVSVSNNSREGLRIFRDGKFDALLLDIAMPEFSGFDIIIDLEKDGRITKEKVIVFTASSISNEEITDLINRGVKAILKKPLKLEELLSTIVA